MNGDLGAAAGFSVLLGTGVWMLKQAEIGKWSLKYRVSLRMEAADHYWQLAGWCKLIRNSKGAGFFRPVLRRFRAHRESKMNREIFASIIYLRNLASIEKGRRCSTDYILEQLAEQNGLLKPIYLKMLHLLRGNQTREAAAYFSDKVGTSSGKDFAGLLIQWDRLKPNELLETLLSYEKSMKASRMTEQKRKDEILSDLIYFPVVVNILVIFINFIYVAYFIDQKEMLQMFM